MSHVNINMHSHGTLSCRTLQHEADEFSLTIEVGEERNEVTIYELTHDQTIRIRDAIKGSKPQIIKKIEMLLDMAQSKHSGKRDIESQLQIWLSELNRGGV